jgi:protein phosphatase
VKPSVGVKTDLGRVRDANEDAYLVDEPIYGIADGMGGHIAGDVASQTAVDTITSRAKEQSPGDADSLAELVKEANAAIWERSQSDPSLHGMGTTCTMVLVGDDHLDIAHVGDSRAYLYRDGELSQITEDHTLVGRMVKEGRLEPHEAERHPQRNIITRALGIDRSVEVDTITLTVREGDRILVCSDGLTSMIEAEEIRDILRSESDPQVVADRLVEAANSAGGEDNITVLILAFGAGAARAAGAAPARELTPIERTGDTRDDRDPGGGVPQRAVDPVETGRSRGSWMRGILVSVLVLAAVLGAAFAFFRFAIVANSYFVGTVSDGHLAIYRGLPDDVLGMTFHDEVETSTISVTDLPEFLQEDVANGIDADSLSDARTTLQNLEARAKDAEFQKPQSNGKKNRHQ